VLGGIDMYDPIDGSQHSDNVTYWDGVVYVAATGAFGASNTAYAIDVSDPYDLRLLSAVGASGPSQAKGVAVGNGKLYVANWTSFLHIYDIYPDGSLAPNYWWLPDNGSPVLQTAAWGIDHDNHRLYVSSSDNSTPAINWRVYIVDVSEPYPANPGDAVISWIQLKDSHTGHLAARGSYLYYTDGFEFRIANISDENAPYVMTTSNLGQLLTGVVIRDDHAYIFCHQPEPRSFYIYDISDPTSPSFVSDYTAGGVNSIYLLGDYALVAGSILHTVDISDPASPSPVGNTDLPEGFDECGQAQITRTNSVTGNGKYAYIGASESYPVAPPCRPDNYARGKLFVARCFDHDPDNAGPADWSESSLGEASWDTQYHGDALPTSSDPAWEIFEGSESWASVSDGTLRINDMGTGPNDRIRWTRNWNATNTRGTTVISRTRCTSHDLNSSSISELGNLFIEDGKYRMQLAVLSDRIRVNDALSSPAEYAVDGTVWRTYRITTIGDSFKVYVDEDPLPVMTGALTSTTERSRIMLGNGDSSAGPAVQDISFDYVYAFSNGAYSPPDPTDDITPTVSAVVTDTKGKGSLSGINPATATAYWSTDGGVTWEQSGGTAWSGQYEAEELPTDATPPWTEPEGNGVTAWVDSGILHIDDAIADWGAKVKWARSWGASPSVGTTLLARVKCNSVQEDPYLGNLFVDDGVLREHFKIMTDRIEVGETTGTHYLDGTQWHVYRVTTRNDQFKVYVDETPTPVLAGTMTATSDQNRVMFGSGSSFAVQSIEFDYVYYTVFGDYAPGEDPGDGGGTVTVVCTGQPGDYSGTITAHDIPLNQDSLILNKVRFSLQDMAGNTGFSPVYNVHIADPPSPDFDDDDDVDQEDFGRLQECLGVDVIFETACRIADFNRDYRVDKIDFGIFQSCMNGADTAPLPGCVYY